MTELINTIIHIIAQLKWKLLVWNRSHILALTKKLMIKISNLKLVILLEYHNIKMFLQKVVLQIGLKKCLWLKKLKILCQIQWHVISDLKGEETVGNFYEKKLQNTNKKELRIEKVTKRIGDKLYVKWKGYEDSFNSWIDKKRHSIDGWIFSKTKFF